MTTPTMSSSSFFDADVREMYELEPLAQKVIHTRRCNGRAICSCVLRKQSGDFLKDLRAKKAKRPTLKMPRIKGMVRVRNLTQFEIDLKEMITSFLRPVDLAQLSMVNKSLRADVEAIAERTTKAFLSAETRRDITLKHAKSEADPWSRYMHMQMTCVHKVFVYYTGYRTAAQRKSTPWWAFGFVNIDPNEPSKAIMPNAWKFHDHSPWLPRKKNGKNGEWMLKKGYQHGHSSKKFRDQVREWAGKLQAGDHLAVAFQHEGSTETTWWEAQIWYVWRADGREDPAVVYDPINDVTRQVPPSELETYFRANPDHVIDVCTVPRSVCKMCVKTNKTFYECHVERGHPMA